jgi:hypothetical protein
MAERIRDLRQQWDLVSGGAPKRAEQRAAAREEAQGLTRGTVRW